MQINLDRTIITKAILAIVASILLLSLVLMVQNFDSSTFKVFEFKNKSTPKKSPNDNDSKCLQATVTSESVVNLGDFLFVLENNRKLAVNISFKYKEISKNSNDFFDTQDNITKEIEAKNSILRDKIISVMLDSAIPSDDNKEMKKVITKTLNKNLTTVKVEEIYFNKFILY